VSERKLFSAGCIQSRERTQMNLRLVSIVNALMAAPFEQLQTEWRKLQELARRT
jgi:hypothetical protein